jgi:hypothetical protein
VLVCVYVPVRATRRSRRTPDVFYTATFAAFLLSTVTVVT